MSSSFPWLTALIVAAPAGRGGAVGGPCRTRPGRRARRLACSSSLLGVAALTAFDVADAGAVQLLEVHGWIPAFGVSYAVGVDGVGLILVLMSVLIVPLVVLAAWREQGSLTVATDQLRRYLALVLLLEAFIVAVFAARDVFFFYVLFEAMLIPVYFMIGLFGGAQRRYAAVKFLLYSLTGGLIMLVAVIALYLQGPGGPQGFLTENLTGLDAGPDGREAHVLRVLPGVRHQGADVPGAHLAAGRRAAGARRDLDAAGRRAGQGRHVRDAHAVPAAVPERVPLGRAGGHRAGRRSRSCTGRCSRSGRRTSCGSSRTRRCRTSGSSCWASSRSRRRRSRARRSTWSTTGSRPAALFLIAGFLVARRGSQQIADFGGLQKIVPVLAGTFLVAGLSALSLPGLSTFISEFLVLVGTFARHPAAAIVSSLGVVLAAIYVLLDLPAHVHRARARPSWPAWPTRAPGSGGSSRRCSP